MTPEERARWALGPLLNPEPHPFQDEWSDGHSMDISMLIASVASAIREAEQAAEESAVEAFARMVLDLRADIAESRREIAETRALMRAREQAVAPESQPQLPANSGIKTP